MHRHYSLATGARLRMLESDRIVVQIDGRALPIEGCAALRTVTKVLANGRAELTDLIDATGSPVTEVTTAINALDRLGLIEHTVQVGSRRLLTVEPMTPRPAAWPPPRPAVALDSAVLSRYAVIHRDANTLVVESPLSNFRAKLDDPEAAGLLMRLATGEGYGISVEFSTRPLGVAPVDSLCIDAVRSCVELLLHAGFATIDGDKVELSSTLWEDYSPESAGWSFHDLLFHSQSRLGAHDRFVGQNYPLRERFPSPPVTLARRGERLVLPTVDIDLIKQQDPSFTAVLERRRSMRKHGRSPMDLAQLSEFLFRAARITAIIPRNLDDDIRYRASRRPYPSGGGAYELELYPIVNRCRGVDPGVYHYAGDAHILERLGPFDRRAYDLIRDAADSVDFNGEPQVLLIVTSRIIRLAWQYSGMAYATTLKNVGVLYQTMYLVASAMSLAPCAIGVGNSPRIASTLRCSYLEEPAVGEFLLGSSG